jgi:hypothetical protein
VAASLEHLAACETCRRQVELDRELVIHLRRALRARVATSGPSAASWQVVRDRALGIAPTLEDRGAEPAGLRWLRPLLSLPWWRQPAPAMGPARPGISDWMIAAARTPKYGL